MMYYIALYMLLCIAISRVVMCCYVLCCIYCIALCYIGCILLRYVRFCYDLLFVLFCDMFRCDVMFCGVLWCALLC